MRFVRKRVDLPVYALASKFNQEKMQKRIMDSRKVNAYVEKMYQVIALLPLRSEDYQVNSQYFHQALSSNVSSVTSGLHESKDCMMWCGYICYEAFSIA